MRFYDLSHRLYFVIGGLAIGLAILLLMFAPLLRKQMKGEDVDSLESEKPDAEDAQPANSAGDSRPERGEDEDHR